MLRVFTPPVDDGAIKRWVINGFPASIITWTAEEYQALSMKPSDAQRCDNGVWVALRME